MCFNCGHIFDAHYSDPEHRCSMSNCDCHKYQELPFRLTRTEREIVDKIKQLRQGDTINGK